MSLNIYDLDKIALEASDEAGIDYTLFEDTRNKIISHLEGKNIKFVDGTKYIESLQQLSTNFCQHVNEEFSEDEVVKELTHSFKRKVSLILGKDRIINLGKNLSKINELNSWNPTTLEAIGRTKLRPNDVVNKFSEYFTEEEKRELLAIYTWIKKQIRTDDGVNVDWDTIIKALKDEGFTDIANKFYLNK
ncbi:MAG: hypothetical protein PHH98_01130 [Candidatus Gracilibacteria bacterium]|nr:hypothetical protein [Candidatus Gracilibacteria bacterium]